MDGFTWVDGIAVLILLVSVGLAYSRGLARESLSIGGWILAAVVSYQFAPTATPLVKEIPLLSDLIGQSCELSTMAGFALVFTVMLIVFAFFVPWISTFVQKLSLNKVDQTLGLLFGVVRGFLLILVVLVLFDRVTSAGQAGANDWTSAVHESKTKGFLADTQARMESMIPDDTSVWLLGHYQYLMRDCPQNEAIPSEITPAIVPTLVPDATDATDTAPESTDAIPEAPEPTDAITETPLPTQEN